MNDLERDLKELFRDQAASIDAPTLAPEPVLRRSRHRRVRTVVTSIAATAVVLVTAVVALGTVRDRTDTVPATPTTYPERTATIDGITVTAPAGWTLIDDSAMARLLPASSESCSFSATGSPVVAGPAGADPSGGASQGPAEQATEPSQSCSSSPVAQAAGIPVLQLSNVQLPAVGFVCGVTGIDRTSFPSDGAAAYVAEFPNGISTAEFDRACPGSEEIVTFADQGVTRVFAAVSVVGSDASPEDVAVVRDFVHGLAGMRIIPSNASIAGPAYVVAAGVDAGTPWRIEAGITSLGTSGTAIGAMLVTTGTDGRETSEAAPPSAEIAQRATALGDGTWLEWGTAPVGVTAITSVAPDGTRTDATLVPWPDGLRSLADPTTLDGTIWVVHSADKGTLETTGATTSVSDQVGAERGDVVASSSTGEVSWRLRWTVSNCLELDVKGQLPGDTGHSACIMAFDGSDPFIGGFSGQDNAVIVVVGPSGMMPLDNANCLDPMGSDGAWGGTSLCVLVIPVGSQVTIEVRDASGTLVNGVDTVQALPGRLRMVESGGSSPAHP
jgi:hypothetical protein